MVKKNELVLSKKEMKKIDSEVTVELKDLYKDRYKEMITEKTIQVRKSEIVTEKLKEQLAKLKTGEGLTEEDFLF